MRRAALVLALLPASAAAQLSAPLDSTTLAAFRWRSIGPAIMGGRVTDVEGIPGNNRVFYVATAAGGIWKTINRGTTFLPLFDREKVVSMGDLAIAPSNPDVLYAGTGEEDSRNSISPGGGVYKSTDGGRTWTLVGLEATQHVGRIVVHPTNPDVVWVAALGRAWGRNPERGLYKTTDGGTRWRLVKFVSDRAGFVDVALDPSDPNTLYAASWERVRGPYFLQSGGPGSALWKSSDGGETWTEVKGDGWPTQMKGRIGIAVAPSNPRVVYALVEADTSANPLRRGERPDTARRQKTNSGLYRSADGGETWALMQRYDRDARPFYYSQVRVDPRDENRVYWMSSVFRFSEDGGKTYRRGGLGIHIDWHAMWIDPQDPGFFVLGEDGGIAITHDKGGTYDFPNVFAIGQFYAVSYDMRKPYYVCGGLQDNGSWCGPSRSTARNGIGNADWFNVGGGDGFYTASDPGDHEVVYSESQGGNISRLDLRTWARTVIRRGFRGHSPFEDSLIVARGDTARPETPATARELERIRAAARADSAQQLRFNWQTPFFLSPHAPTTIYAGANRLLKSTDRGDHWLTISPDLSTRDSTRIRISTRTTGGITRDATGAETHGTITTVAESPVRPGILWAGTDDGNVWLTRNDGGAWESLTGRFPGVPARSWVSRVTPSAFDTATVYVTFDNHRENDFRPHVFASNDFGRTFRPITAGLPADGVGFVHVITEDPLSRDILYLGTDVAAYVSTDRGARWQRFMSGLPTVPVHDLKVHPRDRELIAATHGRSLWVVDVAPLQELVDSVARKQAHFFTPKAGYQYTLRTEQSWSGHKVFQVDNPAYGADFVYRLTRGDAKADTARVVITNVAGDTLRVLTGRGGPGIHRITWDLRAKAAPLSPAALRDSVARARRRQARDDSLKAVRGADTAARGDTARREARAGDGREVPDVNLRPGEERPGATPGEGEGGGGFFGGPRVGPHVEPGEYLATLTVGGKTMRRTVRVERIGGVVNAEGGGGEEDW
ncbi:MAG TPA: hypothetical protein VNA89_16230 [Gemmatimonadaceae bacterium]|nr:hypothetical protein [Gemmatimonadaceae bacterium]